MAEHGNLYRAGVSLCGRQDSATAIPYSGEMFLGGWDEALYARKGNALVVGRIQAALLLVHGERDDIVHVATTLRLLQSPIEAERDFDLPIVPRGRLPHAGHAACREARAGVLPA